MRNTILEKMNKPLPQPTRPVRNPVQISKNPKIKSSRPSKFQKMQTVLVPPTSVRTPIRKQTFQGIVITTPRPKPIQTQKLHKMQNNKKVNFDKLKAVTDLDSDIGEVVDGLTELAQRFPDDFSSLMDTFHHHMDPTHNHPHHQKISSMDILNLANMISQVKSQTNYIFKRTY